MPLIVKDRVRETTTTTGTGTLTLIAPVTGFQSFSVIGNGNTTYYSIVDVATGAWEVGIGTYTSSGTTLSRDTVLESSTGGAKVSFSSGTKDVFCTYPAERSVSQADVGTDPNEIPLNQYLGSMAYQDRTAVNIGGGVATLGTATVTSIQNDTAISNVEPSLMLNFAAVEALDPRITFTRASPATYYNGVTTAVAEQNLFLQSAVPYPSPWGWANGYIGSLGSELVTNGNFSSATGWSGNTGIITGGVAAFVAVAGSIYQNILTVGKRYKLELVVSRFVAAGTFRVRLGGGGTGDLFLNITGTGTYTITGIASVNTTFELISYTTASDFDIDSVSVKESVQNFVAAPDGTSTASTLVADAANATYLQTVTVNAADYIFSVYLRRVTGTGDIQIQTGNGTFVTQTITSTWARYTDTQTVSAGARTWGVRIVTSGDQVEVWGAQLEQRSAVSAYTPTTTQAITNYIPVLLTAASGVPRFDHNPISGDSLGFLVEQQSTNLLTYSEDFANAAWNDFRNSSISSNTTIAPDGTLTADKLVEAATTATHFVQRASIVTISNATTYTATLYAKAAGRNYLQFMADAAGGFLGGVTTVDLLTGTVVLSGTNVTASVISVGNGWYRCSFVATSSGTTARPGIGISSDATVTAGGFKSYTGDGYSGIYIWGAQLEAGAFATSYIATVASQVTRAADAASMTGTNFSSWYNANSSTFYYDFANGNVSSHAGDAPYDTLIGAVTNGVRNASQNSLEFALGWRVRTKIATPEESAAIVVGSGYATTISSPFKITTFLDRTAIGGSGNGGAVVTTSFTSPPSSSPNMFYINGQLNGCIRKLAYYPRRLSNEELQEMTS